MAFEQQLTGTSMPSESSYPPMPTQSPPRGVAAPHAERPGSATAQAVHDGLEALASGRGEGREDADLNEGTAADRAGQALNHTVQAAKLTWGNVRSMGGSSADGGGDPRPHCSEALTNCGAALKLWMGSQKGKSDGGDKAANSRAPAPLPAAARIETNGVILPTDPWKETWDMYVMMLIVYSAVMVPYRICFSADAEGAMFIFEQILTFSFITDVCFSFNTAFLHEEKWICDRGQIANRYLSGWFWIDMPSSIPVELIDLMMSGDSSMLGLLKFLRLFRLLRLLRLLKMGEYVSALEMRYDLNLTSLRIVQMVLKMVFLAHMLGCFWFYTAVLSAPTMEHFVSGETVTWVSSYNDGQGLDATPDVQYLYSLYWALTTLTTVGYGDITPTNDVERGYTLFALLTGALVFGYMLSSIGSLVQAIDRQSALVEEKMDGIKEYMVFRKLPRDLTVRMRKYYEYYYSRKTAFDEAEILGGLSMGLRIEVVSAVMESTIGRIPLFTEHIDKSFQLELFPMLQPCAAAPGDVIFLKGDPSDSLYFLLKGEVDVLSGFEGRVLYRIRVEGKGPDAHGVHFGESVLVGRRRSATHRAAVWCEMFTISGDDLGDLFRRRPREGKILYQALLKEHVRKENSRKNGARFLLWAQPKGSELAAILRLQHAWDRFMDMVALKNNPFRDEEEPEKKTSLSEELSRRAISPPKLGGPSSSSSALGQPSFSAYSPGSNIHYSPGNISPPGVGGTGSYESEIRELAVHDPSSWAAAQAEVRGHPVDLERLHVDVRRLLNTIDSPGRAPGPGRRSPTGTPGSLPKRAGNLIAKAVSGAAGSSPRAAGSSPRDHVAQ